MGPRQEGHRLTGFSAEAYGRMARVLLPVMWFRCQPALMEDRHSRQLRGSHRLRKGRVSIPGQVYHLRFSTTERSPYFRDLFHGRAAIRALRAAHLSGDARTLAFVVMPDHVHWLCELGERLDLSALVRLVKARVTSELYLQPAFVRRPPIWQAGFFDRAVRETEDLQGVAGYIVQNPVRAGLVDRIADFPHWYACWLDDDLG